MPYAGTSGWSGSATSRARALTADRSGDTLNQERKTLIALRRAGLRGLTYQELGRMMQWHHGKSSGVLSRLHKTDQIARLSNERRNRCSVYVHPDHVFGRPTSPQGRRNHLQIVLEEWLTLDEHGTSKADGDAPAFIAALRQVTGIGV